MVFNFCFNTDEEEDLLISPTIDGRLLVQFGDKCDFYCDRIKVDEDF